MYIYILFYIYAIKVLRIIDGTYLSKMTYIFNGTW